MAGVGVMVAGKEMRADDGDLRFMAEAPLPRRKLYEARKARARADRSISDAELRTTGLMLETLVAQAALELALTDESIVIETNQLGWLERMSGNAREKLKDPASNASEPLRLESELAQEKQKVESLQRQRIRVMRQVNILLGRPVDAAWPSLRLPDSTNVAPTFAGDLSRLFQINPTLQGLRQTANAAKLEIEVARRERSPVYSVGVESSVYSGSGDFRQTMVAGKMTLPFFNKSVYRANVERARQQQVATEKEIEALLRKLQGEAVAAHTEADNAARLANSFSSQVIPLARQAAEATQNAWISSKASLLEVLESQRAMLNARLEERRAIAAHQAAIETLRSIIPPPTQP